MYKVYAITDIGQEREQKTEKDKIEHPKEFDMER